MTRLLSKKTALMYKVKKNESSLALSLVYALKQNKRLTADEFATLERATRAGRLFYIKKLKNKIK